LQWGRPSLVSRTTTHKFDAAGHELPANDETPPPLEERSERQAEGGDDGRASPRADLLQRHEGEQQRHDEGAPPVDLHLRLGLDVSAAGDAGSATRLAFEEDLCADLAYASSLPFECFRVTNLEAGSILVVCEILPDPSREGPSPLDAAADLERQAVDPESLLLGGHVTCYTEELFFTQQQPETHLPRQVRRQDKTQSPTPPAKKPYINRKWPYIIQKSPISPEKSPTNTSTSPR